MFLLVVPSVHVVCWMLYTSYWCILTVAIGGVNNLPQGDTAVAQPFSRAAQNNRVLVVVLVVAKLRRHK